MIGNNAFPRSLGNLSREDYLTILLIALVRQCKGEVHLPADAFEEIDSGIKLTTDWDTAGQKLILRTGSPSMMVFEVKAPKWQSQQPPVQPHLVSANTNGSHRVMDEEQMYQVFEKWNQAKRMREWRDQGAAVVANMPPARPDG